MNLLIGVKAMATYSTDPLKGLSSREIPLKKKLFGENQIQEVRKVSLISTFISQFNDFMTLTLIAATIVSACLGEIADAIAILAIVLINGIMGFMQEYRTEKSLQALRQLAAPSAKVLRDGEISVIPASDLVPGDIVILESGDRIPADGELLHTENFFVDESMLTGESITVEKTSEEDTKSDMKIHKKHLAFMGTLVVSGRAKMLVTEIGMDTEMGKIASMMDKIEDEQTPLQKRLDVLGKQLVVICFALCAVVAFLGILRGEKSYDMFLFGVSLAVAAIPEGMPAIVTVVLTLGVQRMIKKKVIIRKLPAVETLGCATVICSDKTGTLTENRMSVRKIYTNDQEYIVTGTGLDPDGDFISSDGKILENVPKQVRRLLEVGVACNNANIKREKSGLLGGVVRPKETIAVGDPTEAAIIVAAMKAGIDKEDIDARFLRIKEIPFDSDRKRMSVIVKSRGELYLFTKGAPDVVLSLCSHIDKNGRVNELINTDKEKILTANENMGKSALRVLACAYKKITYRDLQDQDPERDLTFLGLIGMFDPLRPEAIEAIQKCFTSGIRPIMITGDHKTTALAVAKELKLADDDSMILTGNDLDNMSDSQLLKCIDQVSVYARVTPKHKLRIVRALKKQGHVVAMTGDGVNDAPAVKEADIGVSMGITGTDVTKEASAMILMNDNFAGIVAAIEEGRIIYDNIRKFIRYLLSCNVGEILTMLWASLLGLPIPLLPIQILWMNLVTDGLPAMALGVDPAEKDVMYRKPRGKHENIFSRGLGQKILYRGFLISVGTIAAFYLANIYSNGDINTARTAAFTTLVLSQLIFVFECRTENHGIWEQNPFSNIYLTLGVICSAALLFVVIYIPLFQPIFHTVALDKNLLLLIIALAGLSAII